MSRLCLSTMLVWSVATVGCAKTKEYDLPPGPTGGSLVDAREDLPDAFVTNDGGPPPGPVALTCEVRITCMDDVHKVTVPMTTTTKVNKELAKQVEEDAVMAALALDDSLRCDPMLTADATCTASPTALVCPNGMEFENVTACIPGQHYDASLTAIFADLPAAPHQCAHANDRAALYADALNKEFTAYLCYTNGNVAYQVSAAFSSGDASR